MGLKKHIGMQGLWAYCRPATLPTGRGMVYWQHGLWARIHGLWAHSHGLLACSTACWPAAWPIGQQHAIIACDMPYWPAAWPIDLQHGFCTYIWPYAQVVTAVVINVGSTDEPDYQHLSIDDLKECCQSKCV